MYFRVMPEVLLKSVCMIEDFLEGTCYCELLLISIGLHVPLDG